MSFHIAPKTLEQAVLAAFEAEANQIIDAAISTAKSKLESDLRAATGSLAARVFSNLRMERMGADLVIHVSIEGFDK